MRTFRILAVLLIPLAATPVRAAGETEDWRFIGGALALVQKIVELAAHAPDPQAAQKEVDAMLKGENSEANRLASGLLGEILVDVPPEYRGAFASISRDLLTLARRDQLRGGGEQGMREEALRARKELHAMGLRYWDEQQFREAVKRGDRIAVDLFVAAQGLPANTSKGLPQAR
jgi:hypothetical protein